MNDPVTSPHPGDLLKKGESAFECRIRPRDFPHKSQTVILHAQSQELAVQQLLAQGHVVISVRVFDPMAKSLKGRILSALQPSGRVSHEVSFSFLNHVSTRELIFFAVQLSTLLKAGIALLRALEIIRRGTANPYFQKVIASLGQDVSSGAPLSLGLEKHKKVFPWVWINLVKVGETTGKLPEVLEEIAHYQEASERIKSKVISAFFYPGILTVAVIAALTFLLIFIIPKFEEIFKSQDMSLPVITQIVISASNIVRFQFPFLVVIVVGIVVSLHYLKKTPAGRIGYDHFRLRAPVFGDLLVQVGAVRFSRSLSTLLKAGVQILQGLEISGKLVENHFLESKLKEVSLAVRGGKGLGGQIEAKKIFPVFMTQLISVGEESGQLERFLELIANFYEDCVDTFLTRLSTLLEPILLLFMGGVIGTIVVSMFLPIIQLSTGGGHG